MPTSPAAIKTWQALTFTGLIARFDLQHDYLQVAWAALGFMAALLFGAFVIFMVERWRKRPVSNRLTTSDQMAHFRTLYERGEISPEEFDQIKGLLTHRMRKEIEGPASPTPPAETPEASKANDTLP